MNKIRFIGLLLVVFGIFAAICGGSWEPCSGIDNAFWCAIAGLISAALGSCCLVITGDFA